MSRIKILYALLHVDTSSNESLCDAHRAIWHAELDLLRDYNVGRSLSEDTDAESRDFDNYDIEDPILQARFVDKLRRLLSWCAKNGVEIV